VREVDAEHPAQGLIIRGARRQGPEPGDKATLPPAQRDGLTAERLELLWLKQVVQDHEPVAPVKLNVYGHPMTSDRWILALFAMTS
jgi:hypothetical protein